MDPDLGGMDLLVTHLASHDSLATHDSQTLTGLTGLFVDGLADRRGRRDGTPAVVHVAATTDPVRFVTSLTDLADTSGPW